MTIIDNNGTAHSGLWVAVQGMPMLIQSCASTHWFITCRCETDTEGCVSP